MRCRIQTTLAGPLQDRRDRPGRAWRQQALAHVLELHNALLQVSRGRGLVGAALAAWRARAQRQPLLALARLRTRARGASCSVKAARKARRHRHKFTAVASCTK